MIGPGFAEHLPLPTIAKVVIILAVLGLIAIIIGVVGIVVKALLWLICKLQDNNMNLYEISIAIITIVIVIGLLFYLLNEE